MIYSQEFNSMPRTEREVSYEVFYFNLKLVPLQQN